MKARLLVSVAAGLLGSFLGSQLVTKEGDPAVVIAQLEHALDVSFQPQPLLSSGAAPGGSFKTYTVSAPDGRVLEIQFDAVPTEQDLERIFGQAGAAGHLREAPPGLTGRLGRATQIAPAWRDLEPTWRSLTWSNQQVAKAKTMLRFPSKPAETEAYTWETRAASAGQPWQIEEPRRLLVRKVGLAAGGAVGSFLLAFGALALLTWAWRFLLARIRELSDAVRGK